MTWDMGFDQSIFNAGSLSVTYFNSVYENLIAFVGDPDPLDPDFLNIQEAKTRGIETSFHWGVTELFSFQGGFTYLISRVTDDGGITSQSFQQNQPLLRRPKWNANWAAHMKVGELFVGVDGRYVGKRDDVNFISFSRVENPAFLVWNGNVSYSLINVFKPIDRLKIYARFLNVFDKNYEEVFGFSSPGLSILLGVEAVFD